MKHLLIAIVSVPLAFSVGAVPSVVPSGEIATLSADEPLAQTTVVEGELRVPSTAEGRTLPLAKLDGRGTVVVPSGIVTLETGGTFAYGIPSDVLAKAALWVDASVAASVQGVEGLPGRVAQWLDCREPDLTLTGEAGAYAYTRLVALTNVTHASADVATWFPSYVAASDGANAFLDFGGYGSGQCLRCRDAKGNTKTIDVRWAFVVYGTENYQWGFLFNEAKASFVPGSYNEGGFNKTRYFAHLNGGDNTPRARTGRYRCDREIVDPITTLLTAGFHVLDFPIADGDFHVSGFFDDRGNSGRQGGGRLCEVVLFTGALTEAERLAVETYLYRKWVAKTPSSEISVVAGSAAEVRLPIDAEVSGLNGAVVGRLVKTGAGTFAEAPLDGTEPAEARQMRLDEGAVDSPRATAFVAASAATYETATGKVVRTAASTAGTLAKTGDEELCVGSLADDVQALDVQAGVLRLARLAQPTNDVPADLMGAIEDPSFEAFADKDINPNGSTGCELSPDAALHGWRGTGVGSRPYVVRWSDADTYFTRAGVSFPDGTHAMVLHIDSGCQTTVTLPTAGVYRLSLWAAARPNKGQSTYFGGEFRVSVDGVAVAQIQTTTDAYRKYVFRLPYLAAGAHTLVFQADAKNNNGASGLGQNLVCMFDDVRVDWLSAEDPGVAVTNGGFEANAFQFRTLVATNAIAGWTVSETGDAAGVYLVSADSPKLAFDTTAGTARIRIPEIPEGGRALLLRGTAALAGSVVFSRAGTYTLALTLGAGWQRDGQKNVLTTLPTLGVTVGSLLDATVAVPETCRWPSPTTAGTVVVTAADVGTPQTLTIRGLTAEAVAFVDDVRFTRNAEVAGTRLVNDFDSAGWTEVKPPSDIHDGSGEIVWGAGMVAAAWGATLYDGVNRVGIRNRGAIHRTAHLAAGTYRLSVASMGRFYRYGETPEDRVQSYSGNRFEAWFGTTDGAVTNVIGTFGVDHAERWSRHAFLFTVPEDGDWLIGFRGLCESDMAFDGKTVRSHGGQLAGLVIEPAAFGDAVTLRPDLTIAVAKGARLALDTQTTNEVAEVRLGGRRRSGLITAARFPDYITGTGALKTPNRGLTVIVR